MGENADVEFKAPRSGRLQLILPHRDPARKLQEEWGPSGYLALRWGVQRNSCRLEGKGGRSKPYVVHVGSPHPRWGFQVGCGEIEFPSQIERSTLGQAISSNLEDFSCLFMSEVQLIDC
jgi:hypothetical protein